MDGSSNSRGSGVDVILENDSRLVVEASLRFEFSTTTNQAEYEAVIIGITLPNKMGAEHIKLRTYSKLAVFSNWRGSPCQGSVTTMKEPGDQSFIRPRNQKSTKHRTPREGGGNRAQYCLTRLDDPDLKGRREKKLTDKDVFQKEKSEQK
ncbi:hypothetical protein KIW84_042260 [Lathyrus oleraceus]|uniref:RNase H type-1 domain-containing protein n=1 Tax=Pisum sativum TaxID=3888 RepID=A0A9D4XC26_PEA|nr:hypothetical protein KIW84_042260 [Pisum sativum]